MSRECIGCGCTDAEACVGEDGQPCHWTFTNGDLGICSHCVEAFDDPLARLAEAVAGAAPRWSADEDDDEPRLILPSEDAYYDTLRGRR